MKLKKRIMKHINMRKLQLKQIVAKINLFEYQQIQNFARIKLIENILCGYSSQRKAQFLCCSQYCDKHAIMCGNQACKCSFDHRRCILTSIGPFLDRMRNKLSNPTPKWVRLYFQAKSVIYRYMVNRISQERQSLRDWQQDINTQQKKSLFLYGFDQKKAILCHAPKVRYSSQKLSQEHQKCNCFPLIVKSINYYNDQRETIQAICNKIQAKYSSMISYFNQKIEELQFSYECANLNPTQFLLVEFLKNIDCSFAKGSQSAKFGLDENLKGIKIVPGSLIHLTKKNMEKRQLLINTEKFSLNGIRKIWKGHSEKLFRKFVEGKAIKELFFRTSNADYLQTLPIQKLRSYIDEIIQKLSQGQQQLFNKNIFKKAKFLKNIDPKQLKGKLKKCKRMQYDQVYISNDRCSTAINDVETIKELRNIKNLKKLEIKWCWQIKIQVLMQMIKAIPNLQHLALLGHRQLIQKIFIQRICQLRQLISFFVFNESQQQFYRSFMEDSWFINLYSLNYKSVVPIEESLKLSKLHNLCNIEISEPNEEISTQVIENMKNLKHLTLGCDWGNYTSANAKLIQELQKKIQLRTLSLIGLNMDSKEVNKIITNNSFLNVIIIRNSYVNTNINDETVECMSNLILLQTLCINCNTAITGKNLNKLDGLKILQIKDCSNVKKMQMKQALTRMKDLEHLKINSNDWVDDEVLMGIESCKQLSYLNIHSTSTSGKGVKHLEGLNRLSILVCGSTKIDGNNLAELTKHISGIKRLCIENLNVNDANLLEISRNCQLMTHLDIRNTQITLESLLKIKNLKLVKSGLHKDLNEKLRQKGVLTYR